MALRLRPDPSSTSLPEALPEAPPEGGGSERCIEVHGCLAIGGDELESRTYPYGPTLVRGARSLFDANGDPVEVTRGVIAICRCEKSQLVPLCDGTHRFVPGFTAET